MAVTKNYTAARAMPVPCQVVGEVNGIPVNSEAVLDPQQLLDACIAAIPIDLFPQAQLEEECLRTISKTHGRSLELQIAGMPELWLDAYGNPYGALNTKGNNFEIPVLEPDDLAHYGYRVVGLQDESALETVLQVSDRLRAAHIDTEHVVGILKIQLFPIIENGEQKLVSLEEFKEYLGREFTTRIGLTGYDKHAMEETLRTRFKIMEFYITVRANQVNERLVDFLWAKTEEEFRYMLGRVFRYINIEEQFLAEHNSSYTPLHLNAENPADVLFYFTTYLPHRLGRNVGRMHHMGLWHNFFHTGNASAVGAIVDLDSVRGAPLQKGDTITPEAILRDVLHFIVTERSGFPSVLNIIRTLQEQGYIPQDTELGKRFKNTFDIAYLEERFIRHGTLMENIASLTGEYFDFTEALIDAGMPEFILRAIERELGYTFVFPSLTEEIVRGFRDFRRHSVAKKIRDKLKELPAKARTYRALANDRQIWVPDHTTKRDTYASDWFLWEFIDYYRVNQWIRKLNANCLATLNKKDEAALLAILFSLAMPKIRAEFAAREEEFERMSYQLTAEELLRQFPQRK